MSHVVEGHAPILPANLNQELLKILLLNRKLFNQLKELKHPVPACKQRAAIIFEVGHIDVQHVSERLGLPFQTVTLDLF